MAMSSTKHKITRHYFNFYAPNNSENALVCLVQFASVDTLNYHKEQFNKCFLCLLPPQGFRPEAKSRGGTLVARAYIKDSTYSTNMQSVYRKNLDLLEQGPRGIGR